MNAPVASTLPPQEVESSDIVCALKRGNWVTGLIFPEFERSIDRALASRGQGMGEGGSITGRTATLYRKPQVSSTFFIPTPNEQAFDVVQASGQDSLWATATHVIGRSSSPSDASPEFRATLFSALDLIREQLPETYRTLLATVRHICPIQTTEFRSASHPHFFGAVFITPNLDPVSLAVTLVHELAHHELFLINLIDRLIPAAADYRMAHAPFQGKVRPAIGRLHSAHALFRMIQAEETILPAKAKLHRKLLRETVETFATEDTTPFGRTIINEVY